MDKREKIRTIVKATGVIVACVAVPVTVGIAFKCIIPMEALTKPNKVLVAIGTGIIGGVAGVAGTEYTMNSIDGFFDNIYAVIDKFNNKTETGEKVNEIPV